ncbi:MAG: hypothetical protein II500_01310 [Campylobacter sp.]|nr:hypothetical protein [Campylobacter sp.]
MADFDFYKFASLNEPSFSECSQISLSIGKQPYLSRNLLHNSKNRRHKFIKICTDFDKKSSAFGCQI